MDSYQNSVFIFRRDLRLEDNTALNQALQRSNQVIACFIFDPCQLEQHPYKSLPGLKFMLASLQSLEQQFNTIGCHLNFYSGKPENIIAQLHSKQPFEALFINRDFSPYSLIRDSTIQQVCNQLNIHFHRCDDLLLTKPEDMLKADGKAYKVFTPFYNLAKKTENIALPQPLAGTQFIKPTNNLTLYKPIKLQKQVETTVSQPGGRVNALAILNNLKEFTNYSILRDYPNQDKTTRLSAHLKFGTCSVREVFHSIQTSLGVDHPLIRELYWRDFFSHVAYHFPHVFGQAFHPPFDKIPWSNNKNQFRAWQEGKTGFPIIDAGMRQLNQSGFMHNRVRMITASFLVKDLHIDWRWGERYFAKTLTDYDPCVNNGNWQWIASTGCDSQPYFRVFNPWLQQKKFDPDCLYIKKWVPELKKFPTTTIHAWDKKHCACLYPKPIVSHATQSAKIKAIYKSIKQNYKSNV